MASDSANENVPSPALERLFGELAVRKGYINCEQLRQALADQTELKKLGLNENLGAILCKKNLMDDAAINDVLGEQIQSVERLGDFKVIEKVGRGGMGMVFKARQISMDRIVALKVLSPRFANDRVFVERFVREARSAGGFNHENIVTAVEVGYEPPYRYLVMDFVDGENMRRVLGKLGRLPEKQALNITLQIARALEHALRKGVIHRDVKPDNIMLSSTNVAKLLDMGLACAADADFQNEPSRTGENTRAAGTPHYIAPEAARGEEALDTRADIYSLGCTLYHFLVGETPYEGASGRVVMAKHLTEPFPDVRTRVPAISIGAASVLAKMTAKDREKRHQNPTELITDLHLVMEGRPPRHAELLNDRLSGRNRRRTASGGNRLPTSGYRRPGAAGPRVPSPRMRRPTTAGQRTPTGKARVSSGKSRMPTSGRRLPKARPPTSGHQRPARRPTAAGNSALPPDSSRRQALDEANTPAPKKSSRLALALVLCAILFAVLMIASIALKVRKPQPEAPDSPDPVERVENGKDAKVSQTPASKGAFTPPPAAGKGPAQPKTDIRLESAKRALEKARGLQLQHPTAHATITAAFVEAQSLAAQTELEKACGDAASEAHVNWERAFERALKLPQSRAASAIGRGDLNEAMDALEDSVVPASLRVSDWQARIAAARAPVFEAADKEVGRLLVEAREAARKGDAASIKVGIERVKKAESIPFARNLATAAQARTELERKAVEIEQGAEKAMAERRKKASALANGAWKEIAPLLKQNRFDQAQLKLDDFIADKRNADAVPLLRKRKADIDAMVAFRIETVAAINKQIGKEMTLRKGLLDLKGTVVKSSRVHTVALKLKEGPEMTVGAHELAPADAEKFGPSAEGARRAEGLFRRGLLYLAAGEANKAKAFFEQARTAGMGAEVDPYLELLGAL